VLVEHARNLLGIEDASHAEYGAPGTHVIALLSCSLVASRIDLDIEPGSQLARMYGATSATERTHCNYGLAPEFGRIADAAGMRASARDATGEVRAIERPDHPFFVGTLFQPPLSSTAVRPHPILTAFLRAVAARAESANES
jgi:CTP synthase (UTP-ammonia lyase)